MSTHPTGQDGPPVADLAEAVAHLRNVAEIPGYFIRLGSAAQLVLDALTAAQDADKRVRELCEERQTEAQGGGTTDADTLWPSEVLAALDGEDPR